MRCFTPAHHELLKKLDQNFIRDFNSQTINKNKTKDLKFFGPTFLERKVGLRKEKHGKHNKSGIR